MVTTLPEPVIRDHVYGPVPPVTLDARVTFCPRSIVAGLGCDETVGAGFTVTEAVDENEIWVFISVTFRYILYVFAEDGMKVKEDCVPTTVELPPTDQEYEYDPDPPVTAEVKVTAWPRSMVDDAGVIETVGFT